MNDFINTPDHHQRRFGGIARLYGEEKLHRFMHAHICVVGLGGVGSWTVEALARSGIGQITIIDLDNVAESNINRQLPALTSNFGKAKVDVMRNRIMDINPHCQVTCIEDFVELDNIPQFFELPFDCVIDAIDQTHIKSAMAHYFLQHNQPFIVSGSAGGQTKSELIQINDLTRVTHDRLLANMRYQLRKKYHLAGNHYLMNIPCVHSTENITRPHHPSTCQFNTAPQGLSCSGYGASMIVTASFGLRCAQWCLDLLCQS